jgi:hypothetical protein
MSPDQLAELAKQGLLGVLLLAAISAIAYLYKGRMTDWKEVGEFLRDNTVALRDRSNLDEARIRALEANGRAVELLTVEVVALKNEVIQLRDTLSDRTAEALKSNRDMREVVLGLKEQIIAIYNRCTRGP